MLAPPPFGDVLLPKLTIKVSHAPRRLDNPVQHARADARYRLRAVRSARAVQRGPADDGARRRQTGRLSADCPKARSVSFRVPERSCERASDKECIGYDFKNSPHAPHPARRSNRSDSDLKRQARWKWNAPERQTRLTSAGGSPDGKPIPVTLWDRARCGS